tara:strand:- start:161 stop:835 length:675 start_codon:yes stop_codon:yes gene_type:complete
MDWNLLYKKHIETCRNKPILENEIYHNHHIIPRSAGGSDDKSNLIRLEYRDHVIAHYILYKANPTNSNWIAYRLMSGIDNDKKKLVEQLKLEAISKRDNTTICTPKSNKKRSKSVKSYMESLTPKERSTIYGKHKENHPFWGVNRKGKKAANYGQSKGEYIVWNPEGKKLHFKSLRKMMDYGFDEGTVKRNRNKGKIQKPKNGGRPSKWVGYTIEYIKSEKYGK